MINQTIHVCIAANNTLRELRKNWSRLKHVVLSFDSIYVDVFVPWIHYVGQSDQCTHTHTHTCLHVFVYFWTRKQNVRLGWRYIRRAGAQLKYAYEHVVVCGKHKNTVIHNKRTQRARYCCPNSLLLLYYFHETGHPFGTLWTNEFPTFDEIKIIFSIFNLQFSI